MNSLIGMSLEYNSGKSGFNRMSNAEHLKWYSSRSRDLRDHAGIELDPRRLIIVSIKE